MQKIDANAEQQLDISDLYPDLTAEQQQEAAYYLGRYLDLVRRIFERVSNVATIGSNLTDSDKPPTMRMNKD